MYIALIVLGVFPLPAQQWYLFTIPLGLVPILLNFRVFVGILIDLVSPRRERWPYLWHTLQTRFAEQYHRRSSDLIGEGRKFDIRLHIERQAITEAFFEFIDSSASCFAIIGESGVGKTNAVLSLILRGHDIFSDKTHVNEIFHNWSYQFFHQMGGRVARTRNSYTVFRSVRKTMFMNLVRNTFRRLSWRLTLSYTAVMVGGLLIAIYLLILSAIFLSSALFPILPRD